MKRLITTTFYAGVKRVLFQLPLIDTSKTFQWQKVNLGQWEGFLLIFLL